jgi:hypothetical protein
VHLASLYGNGMRRQRIHVALVCHPLRILLCNTLWEWFLWTQNEVASPRSDLSPAKRCVTEKLRSCMLLCSWQHGQQAVELQHIAEAAKLTCSFVYTADTVSEDCWPVLSVSPSPCAAGSSTQTMPAGVPDTALGSLCTGYATETHQLGVCSWAIGT